VWCQANYPDAQLPAFGAVRGWIVWFVSLFCWTTYFLVPLILANIFCTRRRSLCTHTENGQSLRPAGAAHSHCLYGCSAACYVLRLRADGYSKEQANAAKIFEERRASGLRDAFLLLDVQKSGVLGFDVIMQLLLAMLGAREALQITQAAMTAKSNVQPQLQQQQSAGPAHMSVAVAEVSQDEVELTTVPTLRADGPLVGAAASSGVDPGSASLSNSSVEPPPELPDKFHSTWRRAHGFFDKLDLDHSGTIEQHEFNLLCSILRFDLPSFAPPLLPHDWSIWTHPRFLKLTEWVMCWQWNVVMVTLTLANVIMTAVESARFREDPQQTGSGVVYNRECASDGSPARAEEIQDARVFQALQWTFVCVYIVDVSLQLFCVGWRTFKSDARLLFNLLFTAVSFVVEVLLLVPSLACDENIYTVVMTFRVLRLTRPVIFFTRFYLIIATYIRLLPRFLPIVGVLVSLYVFFAHVGVMVFGGRMYIGSPKLLATPCYGHACNYYAINCNDFGMCVGALWQIMVLSNWHLQVEGFVAVIGREARFFFLVWYAEDTAMHMRAHAAAARMCERRARLMVCPCVPCCCEWCAGTTSAWCWR
jgi:hypothetical protein